MILSKHPGPALETLPPHCRFPSPGRPPDLHALPAPLPTPLPWGLCLGGLPAPPKGTSSLFLQLFTELSCEKMPA